MKTMIFATLRCVQRVASLSCLTWLVACQPKERPNRGDRNERPLDGMERAAAKNVSTETAAIAMQERDVKRLKMLGVYVRNRASVVLMEPNDLKALDLAIQCLEGTVPREERQTALDKIGSGKLKKPASDLCLEQEEEEETEQKEEPAPKKGEELN